MAQATPIPGDSPEIAVQITDKFVGAVDTVRAKTTGPLLIAARAIVYGVLIVFAAVALTVVLIAGFVRLLDSYIAEQIWLPYLILGVVFTLGGMLMWRKRTP